MSDVNEALKIWDALKPMIDKEIEAKTRSCVRAKKMVVKTPPNGTTIGVIEPYETNAINIPYSSAVKDVEAGEAVWVQWFFGNASTMMAIAHGDGDMPFATVLDVQEANEFRAGDSFSFVEMWCASTMNSTKTGATMTIDMPKKIPSGLVPQVSNATLVTLRGANGDLNAPSGTITWSADRIGDYAIRLSFVGTVASSDASAYSAVLADVSATISFATAP